MAAVLLVAGCASSGGGLPTSPAPVSSTPLSTDRSPSPSPTTTAGSADAVALDLSWVSATEGWALSAQPCATGRCIRLSHTSDGGAHWQALPAPPAQAPTSMVACTKLPCVSQVRFASPTVGYLFAPGFLMTTNGGLSWQAQPGTSVGSLTVAGDHVFRIVDTGWGCPGPCQLSLQEAAAGSTAWQTLIDRLDHPPRSGGGWIVASGSTVLVATSGSQAGPVTAQAIIYRSTDAGATWQRHGDPCSIRGPTKAVLEEDLIGIAAAPGGFFAGLCSPHSGFATFLVTSADGGATWRDAGDLPAVQALSLIAAASPTTLAVSTSGTSGSGSFTARLLVSTDAGKHWSTVATDTQPITQSGVPAWLGFETSQVGWWLSGPHSVLTTRDGGANWTQTAFR